MSIFTDSYKTTTGSIHVTKAIEMAIKESFIRDGIFSNALNVKSNGYYKPAFITGSSPSESNIPLFTHPITINNYNGSGYLCTDIRLFVRKDVNIKEIESYVKNKTEFNFIKSRTILNLIWLNEGINIIKNNLNFAGIVFSAWLAETIAKTFALDFKDQMTLTIITDLYYQTLFTDDITFDEDTKQRMVTHTIKATKAPAAYIFEIMDKMTPMKDINDYCSNVKSILENIRLNNFNLPMLLTIIKNSWYGTNSKEIISVAIEHPPTWCAIVYTALSEKTYKSSMIYRIAERFGKRGASDEFINSYNSLVRDQLNTSTEELVIKDFE